MKRFRACTTISISAGRTRVLRLLLAGRMMPMKAIAGAPDKCVELRKMEGVMHQESLILMGNQNGGRQRRWKCCPA